MDLFAKKPVTRILQESEIVGEHSLKRSLGPSALIALGIGAIIGAGIFTLTGIAAATNTGPAIVLAFIGAAIGCGLAGLCYSEFASMIPIAGSAYTYSYATMGELLAWIIGWDLILEYSLGAATVSVGWSSYVVSFLHDLNLHIPAQLTAATGTTLIEVSPNSWKELTEKLAQSLAYDDGINPADLPWTTAWINLPAVFIVLVITGLLVIGIQESARFNNLMVMI